jgi:ketosteroid isomerase-like protein
MLSLRGRVSADQWAVASAIAGPNRARPISNLKKTSAEIPMTEESKISFVRSYFERLTDGDIEGIISMFVGDGIVNSPFLGKIPVRPFFEKLNEASAESELTVFDILFNGDKDTAAAYFRYEWLLDDGSELEFQGIDYFEFDRNGKFKSLSIFYDTHPLREEVGDKYS